MLCLHCKGDRYLHRRGLCWSCYYRKGVRHLYPSTSKFAHRGVGTGNNANEAPSTLPAPTDATPGSPEKVAVLQYRAQNGQQLWHPLDCPACYDTSTPICHRGANNVES